MLRTHTHLSGWLAALALLAVLAANASAQDADTPALPDLGLAFADISNENLDEHGLQYAVQVTEVAANSPAERSGLRAGDLIYQLNDLPVYSAARLVWLVERSSSPDALLFTVVRNAKEMRFEVEARQAGRR